MPMYEQREAIMSCTDRIIMDAITYDAEGAHCATHPDATVVRVIKSDPYWVEDEPVPDPEATKQKAALAAAKKKDDDDEPKLKVEEPKKTVGNGGKAIPHAHR